MNSEASLRDPITPRVLLRYKILILSVAALVIAGGYMRIITQPRRYSATARMAVRFSGELWNLPENIGSVKLPLLEEEVKAFQVQLQDPTFIDQVVQTLPEPEPTVVVETEQVEPTPTQKLLKGAVETYLNARRAVLGFLDSMLFVKDTIVSERERRVAQVLGGLMVTAGQEASHIISITFTDKDARRAAEIANTVALQFIELQKKRTHKKDVARLAADVERTQKALIDIKRRGIDLSLKLGSPNMDEAIREYATRMKSLKEQRTHIKDALALVSQKRIPSDRDLPIQSNSSQSGEEMRSILQTLVDLWEREIMVPEQAGIIAEIREKFEAYVKSRKAEKIEDVRLELENRAQSLDDELERLKNDRSLFDFAPEHSTIAVEQTATEERLRRLQEELISAQKFNAQLEDKRVAQHVNVFQVATVPTLPNAQRRPLKFGVVVVLGLIAGFAAALGRHLVWPKRPKEALTAVGAGDELDVPIIVLPEQGGEDVEGDIEFDMNFPDEEKPRKK